mmetsp:Transcript_76919/g.223351  ORF Transcript_76919/g.223351 Transcript_76919/m.223351 type:complete len:215 (+) Transcript_76919:391-1035(+)
MAGEMPRRTGNARRGIRPRWRARGFPLDPRRIPYSRGSRRGSSPWPPTTATAAAAATATAGRPQAAAGAREGSQRDRGQPLQPPAQPNGEAAPAAASVAQSWEAPRPADVATAPTSHPPGSRPCAPSATCPQTEPPCNLALTRTRAAPVAHHSLQTMRARPHRRHCSRGAGGRGGSGSCSGQRDARATRGSSSTCPAVPPPPGARPTKSSAHCS